MVDVKSSDTLPSFSMNRQPAPSRLEILRVALKLGCISFGGPIAHLGYFHAEYVQRRRWLTETSYAHLVALCQFLPGPASSQLGFSIGLLRGGLAGGFLAWLGFTLPSAILMTLCGYGLAGVGNVSQAGWLEGLKLAAVAVVVQAAWAMAARLCPDRPRASIGLAAALASAVAPTWAQGAVLATGALLGLAFLRQDEEVKRVPEQSLHVPGWGRRAGAGSLALFLALLLGLPMLRAISGNAVVATLDSFYRTGSLVFGGGHVVLPLLQAETVAPGWVSDDRFLAGYGLAQALPGPLFAFAAYLGTVLTPPRAGGWPGGLFCLAAIYLPSGLLVLGVLPFWEEWRQRPGAQAALRGANAAVVGLLLAALYHPVWTSAVHTPAKFALALAAFGLLVLWKWPPWLVVAVAAGGGWLFL